MISETGLDVYRSVCLAQAARAIASVDRNRLSPTYGCCDWRFWHDKTIDIPSGHDQEMAYFLALLCKSDFPGNPYYNRAFILELARAVLAFWRKLIGKRGSLDEFYPNEAQYGATAIVAWAVAETYFLLAEDLTESDRSLFLEGLERTANWLTVNDERTNLANHQAQAMLALFRIHQLTGLRKFHEGYIVKRGRLFGLFREEGWFEEYDHFDPGYQTTCLAFLARLYAHTGESCLRKTILRCLDHLKYVVMPDYHFGAELGSRRTRHVWPSCFELFTRTSPVAGSLAVYYRRGLARGLVHDPRVQDRYFVQQLYDYLWTSGIAEPVIEDCGPLPFQGGPFARYFPESGIVALKNENRQCLAVSLRKGGAYSYCKLNEEGAIVDRRVDAGIAAVTEGGDVLTSDFCGGEKHTEVRLMEELASVKVGGRLHFARFLYPSPGRFLLFRMLTLCLARWGWALRNFRYFLAKLLMLNRAEGRDEFERNFEVSPRAIRVTSAFFLKSGGRHRIAQILFGVEASSVYVPISKGFDLTDAACDPVTIEPGGRDHVERIELLK